jgi:hypothetical protein
VVLTFKELGYNSAGSLAEHKNDCGPKIVRLEQKIREQEASETRLKILEDDCIVNFGRAGSIVGQTLLELDTVVRLTLLELGNTGGLTLPELGTVVRLTLLELGTNTGLTSLELGTVVRLTLLELATTAGLTSPEVGTTVGLTLQELDTTVVLTYNLARAGYNFLANFARAEYNCEAKPGANLVRAGYKCGAHLAGSCQQLAGEGIAVKGLDLGLQCGLGHLVVKKEESLV